MEVKIKNLTKRPVLLRLNSGQTLHIAPESSSSKIWEQEVTGNTKFEKLKNLNIVSKVKEENLNEKGTKPIMKEVKETKEKKKSNSKKEEKISYTKEEK